MTSARRISNSLAAFVALIGLLLAGCEKVVQSRPLTAAELQGEWVQDPDFLQHAGADLEAQKREIDQWENYEFVFNGQRLTAWRMVHDEATRDAAGWSQGKGAHFESDYSMAPADKAVTLTFTDNAKAQQQAVIGWDGEHIAVSLGERKFRLKRAPADNLRARKLVAIP